MERRTCYLISMKLLRRCGKHKGSLYITLGSSALEENSSYIVYTGTWYFRVNTECEALYELIVFRNQCAILARIQEAKVSFLEEKSEEKCVWKCLLI
ncbi:hypothetical protein ABG067_002201 [Albugo candida]|uniref:Uncharacterized protein n=1 Tax=Albugo candida TaxID=65357 RepID=A0A024G583_9STRA|nr:unnamed protein product [Albugo candida]|eukprot:CCI42024.1 unnamed protein product [Albugo candida]